MQYHDGKLNISTKDIMLLYDYMHEARKCKKWHLSSYLYQEVEAHIGILCDNKMMFLFFSLQPYVYSVEKHLSQMSLE